MTLDEQARAEFVRNHKARVGDYSTLAIVGSHPDSLHLVPWGDPSVELWLFNEAPQKPEKYARWNASLQIHSPEVYASTENWVNKDHWTWLQQDHGDKAIYMQDVDLRVPNSLRYPLEGVLSLVPYRYLRSSPAMALAMAIYMGYPRIEIYGSELSSNTEYNYQAINFAFWIGFAHGRGVDLQLRCWQSEFEQRIYGFDGELSLETMDFEKRLADLTAGWQHNERMLERLKVRFTEAVFAGDVEKAATMSLDLEHLAQATGETAGAHDETENYTKRTNPVNRQEFERRSAQAQRDGDQIRCDMLHAAGRVEYVWNVWKQTGLVQARDQFKTFAEERTDLAYRTGYHIGIYRENASYLGEYDERIQAAGGVRALHAVQDPYRR